MHKFKQRGLIMQDKVYKLETPNGDCIIFGVTCETRGCRVLVDASLSVASATELFGQANEQPCVKVTASYFIRSAARIFEGFIERKWLYISLDGMPVPDGPSSRRIADRINGLVTIYMKPSRLRSLRNAIALGERVEYEENIYA